MSQRIKQTVDYRRLSSLAALIFSGFLFATVPARATALGAGVPKGHPRLLGPRRRLQKLAVERPQAYKRLVSVAREQKADDHAKMISIALVCAIEQDEQLGKVAVQMAMKYVNGPIRKGHVTFGSDLARSAVVYDLCHPYWTAQQRSRFHDYMNKTVDANVRSETHVFHNGWYGYKHWGIGLACYATYYENPRAREILNALEQDWKTRAAPAFELAGAGGGWAEGYYINYFLYEWLFFCEAARRCEGKDYYADAPSFFKNRAVASMFEAYPGIGTYNSRRSVPMGDGGGRVFGGDRDKTLSARRILVNHFRNDPAHQAVHTFNETTPRSSVGVYAYKDFLWRDAAVKKADLNNFKLSHISPGPGYVYARSSWANDATYFFFKASDRFTAHQHLDVGHFVIYKHAELIGDGGHYDSFGSAHDVNYHLRTVAHNTILVRDPAETWPGIRAGRVTGNDGGQHHNWPHHNGAVTDPQDWRKNKELYDIAEIIAFKKTFLLQAMTTPTRRGKHLVVTNGQGRLFIQTLLPTAAAVGLVSGDDLYKYGGKNYQSARDTGPAPQCRIEISPSRPSNVDYFLQVLTAADAQTNSITPPDVNANDAAVSLTIGATRLTFQKASPTLSIQAP
ncbi:MAG: heparinase II/III family protein [Phycisphaerae bacterium]|nr:heparinase II/III family protein [Phycisphaerae bacterium]